MGWYITIQQEMRDALGLKGNELLVYAVIYGYSQEGQGCFYGSLAHLCNICGMARNTAISTLKSLIEKGYITRNETMHNGVKYVAYAANVKNCTGSAKIAQGGSAEIAPNNKENIYINNTLSIKGRSRFVKPSVEAVAAYCKERGNSVNAQTFVDFYESNGWKVGKASMKDWRAAVRTWESRERHSSPNPSPRKKSNFQVMSEMLQRNRETIKGGQADEQ